MRALWGLFRGRVATKLAEHRRYNVAPVTRPGFQRARCVTLISSASLGNGTRHLHCDCAAMQFAGYQAFAGQAWEVAAVLLQKFWQKSWMAVCSARLLPNPPALVMTGVPARIPPQRIPRGIPGVTSCCNSIFSTVASSQISCAVSPPENRTPAGFHFAAVASKLPRYSSS